MTSETQSQGNVIRMNSTSSDGDLKSVEMAGIDDDQSGRLLNDSFDSDGGFNTGIEQQYIPRQNVPDMTPIQEEDDEIQRLTTL